MYPLIASLLYFAVQQIFEPVTINKPVDPTLNRAIPGDIKMVLLNNKCNGVFTVFSGENTVFFIKKMLYCFFVYR